MEDVGRFLISNDATGKQLDGGMKYKLHLPSNIPVVNFWSVIVYDSLSRLIISTDQPWPSVFKSSRRLVINQDGSVDIRFGPEVSADTAGNSIKTIPGKTWYMILNLYGLTESSIDNFWKPGDIEEEF